jgi:hypothetical protein
LFAGDELGTKAATCVPKGNSSALAIGGNDVPFDGPDVIFRALSRSVAASGQILLLPVRDAEAAGP